MLQPFGKKILVEPIIKEKKTVLFALKEESPDAYKISAIGDDVKKASINDIVILDHYAISQLKYGDEIYYMINEENVYAKVIT